MDTLSAFAHCMLFLRRHGRVVATPQQGNSEDDKENDGDPNESELVKNQKRRLDRQDMGETWDGLGETWHGSSACAVEFQTPMAVRLQKLLKTIQPCCNLQIPSHTFHCVRLAYSVVRRCEMLMQQGLAIWVSKQAPLLVYWCLVGLAAKPRC